MNRKRGRPSIGSKKTFTISEQEYLLFKKFCQRVLHKRVSAVIRGLIERTNDDLEKWAKGILAKKNRERS